MQWEDVIKNLYKAVCLAAPGQQMTICVICVKFKYITVPDRR